MAPTGAARGGRTACMGAVIATIAAGVVLAPVVSASAGENPTSWPAAADLTVRADRPTTRYGASDFLRADGSPEARTYLRFAVTDAPDGPQPTVLRLRRSSASPDYLSGTTCDADEPTCWSYVRVSVRRVAGDWDEATTTWENAPPTGDRLGTAPDVRYRKYGAQVDIDVGELINGDGIYDLAVTGDTATNSTFASREQFGGVLAAEPVISAP
jgi:hypothetical protein